MRGRWRFDKGALPSVRWPLTRAGLGHHEWPGSEGQARQSRGDPGADLMQVSVVVGTALNQLRSPGSSAGAAVCQVTSTWPEERRAGGGDQATRRTDMG